MRGFTAWSAAASTPPRWPLAHFFCSAFVEQNPWVPGFIVFITAGEISILFLQTLPLSPSLPPPSEPPVHGVAGPTAHRYPLHLPVVSLRSILAGSAAVSWRSLISSATSGLSLTPSTEVFTSELVPSDVDVVGQGRSRADHRGQGEPVPQQGCGVAVLTENKVRPEFHVARGNKF